MFQLEFLNTPESFAIDDARIELIAKNINNRVDITQKGIVHVAFVADDEMQQYNKNYRGKDYVTDVLSFHYFEDYSQASDDEVVAEVLLSESKILSQSYEKGHTPNQECEILLIHSLLHLLGFDHEMEDEYQEMWKYEQVLREQMNLNAF